MPVAGPLGGRFEAVDDAVGGPAKEQRETVPLPLLEARFHAELRGEHLGKFHLEADEARRMLRIDVDMRPAPFLIGRPDELPAGEHLVELGRQPVHGNRGQQPHGRQQPQRPTPEFSLAGRRHGV